jgi:valyl-tRNA synthetase
MCITISRGNNGATAMKLSKTYDPQDYESDIYDLWEKSDAFKPSGKGEPFSMVLPPPNANAPLHIGHSLNYSIMDIIARYQRAQGRNVLMLPGADHAGFETQVVYEKHLLKEGKSRFDFDREELYSQIWDFVQGNRGVFESQLRSFGVSCDWSSFTFTLDKKIVDTAYKTFKKLWDDGLIYRGERLVNYCTEHQTGFADIEVEYKDAVTPLYYMKYGPFELATTRPETKFGDTAVAVHPDDKRYSKYVGKEIEVEGVNGTVKLQVVADDMVDMNFGTGAVKITPAHDPNDWEVAKRHNLEVIKVINLDGTMNERAGEYEGMTVLEARKSIVEALKEKDLLVKVDKKYKNRVGVCYKCSTVIEPMLLEQWFINMKELAKPAIKALKDKKITFYPEQKRQQTIQYLENVYDWNISRQIAWGIPIPAFQNVDDPSDWIFNEQVQEHTIEQDGKTYKRDSDVFDTWFSSGQWPYATLDEAGDQKSDTFKKFYPNSLMECGIDIMFMWVSRMICLGLYTTGEVPFSEVYLHGMVRAEDGTKMSKSKGNGVDPHGVLQEFGSDAVRMGMIAGRSAGESAAYAPAKIIAGRNFCNKLWNVARFVEYTLEHKPGKPELKPYTALDHWMLCKLQHTTTVVNNLMSEHRLSEAYDTIYHFVWDEFADWYVEASKKSLNPELLRYGLNSILKLSHPFAPFVTETIWQTLDWTGNSLLINQEWEDSIKFDSKKAQDFEEIKTIVAEIRIIKSRLKLKSTALYYTDIDFLQDNSELIGGLANIEGVHEVEDGKGLHLTSTKYNCWLDIDLETIKRYSSELKKAQNKREGLQKRLGNSAYLKQAPKKLVDETRQQLEDVNSLVENIESQIARFSS